LEEIENQKEGDLREIGHYFFNKWAKTKRTKDKYVFGPNWKTSMKIFMKTFNKYEIMEAIDIAFGKFNTYSPPDQSKIFSYTCGILNNWRKEKSGKPSN